jgi:hypothetical protein
MRDLRPVPDATSNSNMKVINQVLVFHTSSRSAMEAESELRGTFSWDNKVSKDFSNPESKAVRRIRAIENHVFSE